jgi:ubiquinone/menaquinone biosynthesis C-methylase UbiE
MASSDTLTNMGPLQSSPGKYVCPLHRSTLVGRNDLLICAKGDAYPIQNGIPRFTDGSTYSDAFGLQWNRYRLTQLDSYSGVPITKERIRRCLGEKLWASLTGKCVLECGCGAGRFTEVLLDRGASVVSIDLSSAVDANQRNFPQSATHRIAQADIFQLPFQPEQFDIVLCLGVIQHTPNPEKAIAALTRNAKPGGYLVIDHYTYCLSEFTKTAIILRQFLKRLSPARGLGWTERMVNALLPLHRSVRGSRVAQMMLSRISPVICYYSTYPQLDEQMQREWALLDTHDSLTCWYRHFRTKSQIKRALLREGFEAIVCDNGGNGIEARGRRPSLGD